MNRNDPTRTDYRGPLDAFLAPHAEQLRSQQYARSTAREHEALAARFSCWLDQRHVLAAQVTLDHVKQFLRYRRRCGYRRQHGVAAALKRLLSLIPQTTTTSASCAPVATTPVARLLADYDQYLQEARALAPATRLNHRSFVDPFLRERFATGPIDLSCLRPSDITAFVQRHAPRSRARVGLLTTALRAFLRFARERGTIQVDLAAVVPAVARWSLSTLPRFLAPEQVQRVLAHCNRQTALGRRDFAIVLLLARLGLRAGEVAALTLDDIDWDAGRVTVRGKGGRLAQLPLPTDVGAAIAMYVHRDRRHDTGSRCVFLRGPAPAGPFKGQQGVGSVVKHALARAGIDSPRKGSHLFRHTLATQLLRHGASLSEIGEVLRHRHPDTTAIYAKVDVAMLRTLAMPWPGGAQ